jgi:hypothetical protein
VKALPPDLLLLLKYLVYNHWLKLNDIIAYLGVELPNDAKEEGVFEENGLDWPVCLIKKNSVGLLTNISRKTLPCKRSKTGGILSHRRITTEHTSARSGL